MKRSQESPIRTFFNSEAHAVAFPARPPLLWSLCPLGLAQRRLGADCAHGYFQMPLRLWKSGVGVLKDRK